MLNKGAAIAATLHAVTIRSHLLATAADSKGSPSLVLDHMLAPQAHVDFGGDAGVQVHPAVQDVWLFVGTVDPPLESIESVIAPRAPASARSEACAGGS